MTATEDRDLTTFRPAVAGSVLTEADEGYDEARKVWNGEIDRRPAVIVRCTTPGDVAASLAYAREAGLEVTVRGGGHNLGGSAVADGALTIDLRGLRQVNVDAEARTARVGGGATWAELDAAAQEHGLALPGGTWSDTGVGGLTLGGGFGWLTGKFGLTIDNLLSAEVVTADGQVLRASADEHPDLFWALRGGGGNFGIVTEFEYRLHPVGPLVQLGMFFWEAADGEQALRFLRDIVAGLPDETGVLIGGLCAPPAPFVPAEHHGKPGYALIIAGFDGPEEHAKIVEKVRGGLPTLFELVTPIPYVQLQQILEGAPPGVLAYEKGLYVEDLSDDIIDVLVKQVPGRASELSLLQIFPMRGAYAAAADDATAFGGRRSPGYLIGTVAVALTPELHAADRAWVRAMWTSLVPHAGNVGGYVNFMSEYEDDRVRASYGPEKYERLAAIKGKYDPYNVFHHNVNIRPSGG